MKIVQTALVVMLTIIILVAVLFLTRGCTLSWTKPGDAAALEQNGTLVRIAAKNAVLYERRCKPGEWETPVCNVASTILKALDGDKEALQRLHLLGVDPVDAIVVIAELPSRSTITIPTKDLLLDLLRWTAAEYGLDDIWQNQIADVIAMLESYSSVCATTEYETWYLTHAFFAGIVEGCSSL